MELVFELRTFCLSALFLRWVIPWTPCAGDPAKYLKKKICHTLSSVSLPPASSAYFLRLLPALPQLSCAICGSPNSSVLP